MTIITLLIVHAISINNVSGNITTSSFGFCYDKNFKRHVHRGRCNRVVQLKCLIFVTYNSNTSACLHLSEQHILHRVKSVQNDPSKMEISISENDRLVQGPLTRNQTLALKLREKRFIIKNKKLNNIDRIRQWAESQKKNAELVISNK